MIFNIYMPEWCRFMQKSAIKCQRSIGGLTFSSLVPQMMLTLTNFALMKWSIFHCVIHWCLYLFVQVSKRHENKAKLRNCYDSTMTPWLIPKLTLLFSPKKWIKMVRENEGLTNLLNKWVILWAVNSLWPPPGLNRIDKNLL